MNTSLGRVPEQKRVTNLLKYIAKKMRFISTKKVLHTSNRYQRIM